MFVMVFVAFASDPSILLKLNKHSAVFIIRRLFQVSDPGQGVYGIGEHVDVGVMTLLVTVRSERKLRDMDNFYVVCWFLSSHDDNPKYLRQFLEST